MSEIAPAIRFVRHPRARRMRLRFDVLTGQAVVTLPKRASEAQGRAFVEAQGDWLEKQRPRRITPQPLQPEMQITVFGEPVLLGDLVKLRDPLRFQSRILRLLKNKARAQYEIWAAEFSAALHLPAPQITVRDTRSRWGSCTSRGHLNLSWRLILAPHEVARYVVAHEVAHRRELNHSPAFWQLVENLVGPYTESDRWLSKNGATLHSFGVAELPQEGEMGVNTSAMV